LTSLEDISENFKRAQPLYENWQVPTENCESTTHLDEMQGSLSSCSPGLI